MDPYNSAEYTRNCNILQESLLLFLDKIEKSPLLNFYAKEGASRPTYGLNVSGCFTVVKSNVEKFSLVKVNAGVTIKGGVLSPLTAL